MMTIGDRISRIRTGKRYTVQEMMNGTGINRETLLSYENDGVQPSEDDLTLIARYLGVSNKRLMGTDVDLTNVSYHINKKNGEKVNDEDIEMLKDIIREHYPHKVQS